MMLKCVCICRVTFPTEVKRKKCLFASDREHRQPKARVPSKVSLMGYGGYSGQWQDQGGTAGSYTTKKLHPSQLLTPGLL